jgi:hypothetical protein
MSSVTIYLNKEDEKFLRTFEGANLSQQLKRVISLAKDQRE